MKKFILLTLVTLFSVGSAFAERETSKLQYVETATCGESDLANTIIATADRVLFEDTNLSVLESALKITPQQKAAGIKAEVSKVDMYDSSRKVHAKNVENAEAKALLGQVGVIAPTNFYVVYQVVNGSGKRISSGHVDLGVACRIEKSRTGEGLRHASQLIDFAVKAKGTK